MDEPDKTLDFQVCPSHEMRMNLIPWAGLEEARSADMEMIICGNQNGTRWAETRIIDGAQCSWSIEILGLEAMAGAYPQYIMIHTLTLEEQLRCLQYARQNQRQYQYQYQLQYSQQQQDFLQYCLGQTNF
jgi:hypothetical protein